MSTTPASRCPFEHIQNPDLEAEQIAELTNITVRLLDKRYPDKEKISKFQSEHYPSSIQTLRGVHSKSHGCVKAVFEIHPDIARDLQVGLFSEPGKKFDALIRFSNATGPLTADVESGQHNSRGMAIKVFDVGGDVLTDDNGAHNQDFLMINQSVFAFANTPDYLQVNKLLDTPKGEPEGKPDGFFAQLQNPGLPEDDRKRISKSLEIVKSIKIPSNPVVNPLEAQYFSAAPFLFGSDKVMKFSAKPRKEVSPKLMPAQPSENYLREILISTMQNNEPIIFDFLLQIRSSVDEQDIENASTEWDETVYKFTKVATITILAPQTEIDTEENIAHCELMAFTPWHSLVEHQPIGSINRLRKDVYEASAKHRGANMPKADLSKEGEQS
jgi:hypothetical protein